MDDVGPGAGNLVVDLGGRGEEGFTTVGGYIQGVEGEDVAEVGVERLWNGLGGFIDNE